MFAPTEGDACLDRHRRDLGGKDRLLQGQRLILERFPTGHGDDPHGDAQLAECGGRFEAEGEFAARSDEHGVGVLDIGQDVCTLGHAIDTTVLDVLRNDSDPDGSLDRATLVIDSGSDMADVVVQDDGTIRFTPRAGFLGTTQFRYVISDNDGRPSGPTDVTVLVVVSIYQNPRNRFDVDDDGTVSPLDVLVLINLLNSQAPSLPVDGLPGPPAYVDVNADNRVDPLDVLNVINHINSRGNGEGEGGADRTFDDVFASDDWQEELRKTNRLRLIKF